jgi:hypothetical protein
LISSFPHLSFILSQIQSEYDRASSELKALESQRSNSSKPDNSHLERAVAEAEAKVAQLEGALKVKKAEVAHVMQSKSSDSSHAPAAVSDPNHPPYHHGDITREVAEGESKFDHRISSSCLSQICLRTKATEHTLSVTAVLPAN